jgi:hypothetical protein
MIQPFFLKLFLKDLVDFFCILVLSMTATLLAYYVVPSFETVQLSLYFFEQFLELFFVNPTLIWWLFGLGFGITILYFLFCSMLFNTTIGGLLVRVIIVDGDSPSPKSLSLGQVMLLGAGAFFGVCCFLVGPLSGWWLDPQHRGWGEKLAKVRVIKKSATVIVKQ